jgi:hypothetical protein
VLKLILSAALAVAVAFLVRPQIYRFGGAYVLQDNDHAKIMASHPAGATKTLSLLFVGNSLTYVNDMPGMLANIAASDKSSPVALQIKAITYPNAKLDYMYAQSPALAYAQHHHIDYVVLQEHSDWYAAPGGFQDASNTADDWTRALRSLGEKPIYFEVWGEGAGSPLYWGGRGVAGDPTPLGEATDARDATERLATRFGMPYAPVGDAFEEVAETPGAPDLYKLDRHHPSPAGSYLAALVFYRFLTGRSGAEATYRPWGMSAPDAATLVKAASVVCLRLPSPA